MPMPNEFFTLRDGIDVVRPGLFKRAHATSGGSNPSTEPVSNNPSIRSMNGSQLHIAREVCPIIEKQVDWYITRRYNDLEFYDEIHLEIVRGDVVDRLYHVFYADHHMHLSVHYLSLVREDPPRRVGDDSAPAQKSRLHPYTVIGVSRSLSIHEREAINGCRTDHVLAYLARLGREQQTFWFHWEETVAV